MKLGSLNPSDGIAIFTDGSAYYKDRTGGWAFVAVDAFEGMEWSTGAASDATNNQMEMTAAIEGLRRLHQVYGPQEVLVFSDSEYLVKGAQDRTRKRNKNKGYWARLDSAVSLHPVALFEHVRGHSGHTYNEMADELAGQARKGEL